LCNTRGTISGSKSASSQYPTSRKKARKIHLAYWQQGVPNLQFFQFFLLFHLILTKEELEEIRENHLAAFWARFASQ